MNYDGLHEYSVLGTRAIRRLFLSVIIRQLPPLRLPAYHGSSRKWGRRYDRYASRRSWGKRPM